MSDFFLLTFHVSRFTLHVSRTVNLFLRKFETCHILRRDFNWSDDDAYDIYNLIGSLSIVVTPTERIEVIEQDPDDNRILECAVEGNVNYIVSGDRHLLDLGRYRGIEIITTSEFLFLL